MNNEVYVQKSSLAPRSRLHRIFAPRRPLGRRRMRQREVPPLQAQLQQQQQQQRQ